MAGRVSEIIHNAAELVDGDPVMEEVVDVEKLLPEEVFDGDAPPADVLRQTTRPRSHRRKIEDYFEQKQLDEWLHDPLDDTSH